MSNNQHRKGKRGRLHVQLKKWDGIVQILEEIKKKLPNTGRGGVYPPQACKEPVAELKEKKREANVG